MLDYFSQLAAAVSQDEVWRLHCSRMAKFGFDRLLYFHTRFRAPDGFGNPDDALFLSSHAPDITRRYVDDGLFRHDPVLGWATRKAGARSWRAAFSSLGEGDRNQRQSRSLHSLMNVDAGYTIAFSHASPRAVGYIHLAARADLDQDAADAIWDRDGRQIETMNHIVNLKLITLPRTDKRGGLTARQREALEWVGEGKSYREIAQIMGVTPATVEKHLRLARAKLGVDTTAQAILKATMQNQIFQC
jgi:LuxR family transcriptional regulator